MQKFLLEMTQAGPRCRDVHQAPTAGSEDLAASEAP
jgi:hypothetical protein